MAFVPRHKARLGWTGGDGTEISSAGARRADRRCELRSCPSRALTSTDVSYFEPPGVIIHEPCVVEPMLVFPYCAWAIPRGSSPRVHYSSLQWLYSTSVWTNELIDSELSHSVIQLLIKRFRSYFLCKLTFWMHNRNTEFQIRVQARRTERSMPFHSSYKREQGSFISIFRKHKLSTFFFSFF